MLSDGKYGGVASTAPRLYSPTAHGETRALLYNHQSHASRAEATDVMWDMLVLIATRSRAVTPTASAAASHERSAAALHSKRPSSSGTASDNAARSGRYDPSAAPIQSSSAVSLFHASCRAAIASFPASGGSRYAP